LAARRSGSARSSTGAPFGFEVFEGGDDFPQVLEDAPVIGGEAVVTSGLGGFGHLRCLFGLVAVDRQELHRRLETSAGQASVGASLADGFGKPGDVSDLGLGDGWVALALGAIILVLVSRLAITGTDIQKAPALEAQQA
jgi:hypothetical protein